MTILSEKRKEKNENKGTTEIYNQQIPKALMLTLISINAALYAVAIAVTSPIPTPWGIGHFRPGVVIPAFFTVVFGPLIGGLGAAIGCFLGDFALSFFGLTTPMLSLVAGVPGNFIGFYVLGWLISKNRSYSSFIISNFVALLIGNFVAALGVLAYFVFIVPDWILWPISLQIAVVAGLTLFWVSTMVVFVTPLVPVMVTYIEPTLSKIGVKGVSNLSPSSRMSIVKSAGLVAIFLIAIYSVLSFTPGGDMLFAGVV
ncbi:MAG: ECF transporter S component, partial [Candidatus Bathyarchaeia archaeon]